MSSLDLVRDCSICGAKGKGDWCGDDREEPDATSWLCPCEAAYSHKNMASMMERLFAGDSSEGE